MISNLANNDDECCLMVIGDVCQGLEVVSQSVALVVSITFEFRAVLLRMFCEEM